MRNPLAVLALVSAGALFGQFAPNVPEELDASLRARVSGFYGHFQDGQFREAEGFVDEGSRETFYNTQKSRILGFDIADVQWGEDLRSAKVRVTIMSIIPAMGSKPIPIPVNSEWRLIDGEWYMHLISRPNGSQTPFGIANESGERTSAAGVMQGGGAPSVSQLRRLVTFNKRSLSFTGAETEPTAQTVDVKTAAEGGLTVELALMASAPDGLSVSVEPAEIPAGGSAVVTVTYDASAPPIRGRHRLEFEVKPTGQRIRLFVDVGQAEAPKAAAK